MTLRAHARRHLTATLLGTAVLASIAGLATRGLGASVPPRRNQLLFVSPKSFGVGGA
jgi:hypothetical protein